MSQAKEEAYAKANSLSFGGELLPLKILAAEKLIRPIIFPLGSQPLGVCTSESFSAGNQLAFVGYFEPVIYFGHVEGENIFEMEAIRFVSYKGKSRRLFPPNTTPAGANRAQTVNYGPDGTMIVSANASRTFFVIRPKVNDGWFYLRRFNLPCYPNGQDQQFVHSAFIDPESGKIIVTTSGGNLRDPWEIATYELGHDWKPKYISHYKSSMSDLYGIGFRGDDEAPWFITDSRSNGSHGIYRGDRLVMPGITGNGVAFLKDGSALVTRYGPELRHQGDLRQPFGGNPGALIYIHHSLIDAALKRLSV